MPPEKKLREEDIPKEIYEELLQEVTGMKRRKKVNLFIYQPNY